MQLATMVFKKQYSRNHAVCCGVKLKCHLALNVRAGL